MAIVLDLQVTGFQQAEQLFDKLNAMSNSLSSADMKRLKDLAEEWVKLGDTLSQARAGVQGFTVAHNQMAGLGREVAAVQKEIDNLRRTKLDEVGVTRLENLYMRLALATRQAANDFDDYANLTHTEIVQRLADEGRLLQAIDDRIAREKMAADAARLRQQKGAALDPGQELLDMAMGEQAGGGKGGKAARKGSSVAAPAMPEGSGGLSDTLNHAAQSAARLNIIPRGYEMMTVRFVQMATAMGKWTPVLGLAAAGVQSLNMAVSKLAETNDKDAARINTFWDNLGKRMNSTYTQLEAMSVALGKQTGAVGLYAATLETIQGATGIGTAEDPNSPRNQDQQRRAAKALNQWRVEQGVNEARDARVRMIGEAGFADLGKRQRDIDLRIGQEHGQGERAKAAGNAEEMKASDARLQQLNAERQAILNRGVALREQRKAIDRDLKDAGGQQGAAKADLAAAGNDMEKDDAKRRIDDLKVEIQLLNDRRQALNMSGEAAIRAVRAAERRAEVQRDLNALEEKMGRREFDVSRIADLDRVNARLEHEYAIMQRLAKDGSLSDRDRAERMARINSLVARRNEELDRQRAIELELAEIQRLSIVNVFQQRIDAVAFEEQKRAQTLSHERQILSVQHDMGNLSTEELNRAERSVVERQHAIEDLKKTQKIERERLDDERKHVEELKKTAKTAEEYHSAENRALEVTRKAADLRINQERQLAQFEQQKTLAIRQQMQVEEMRAQQRAQQEMQMARQFQQQRLTGQGGAVEQMRGRVTDQQVNVAMLNKRFNDRVTTEEKKKGRKLTAGERQKIFSQERMQAHRDLKGPSAAQQRREMGRQRKAEMNERRQRASAMKNMPPEQRRMMQQAESQAANINEGERKGAFRSGGLAQGMQAGVNSERGSALGGIVNNQVKAMQQSGRITGSQMEAMQILNNSLSNLVQTQAELQQRIGIISSQIQATNAASERVKAQRAGQQRY